MYFYNNRQDGALEKGQGAQMQQGQTPGFPVAGQGLVAPTGSNAPGSRFNTGVPGVHSGMPVGGLGVGTVGMNSSGGMRGGGLNMAIGGGGLNSQGGSAVRSMPGVPGRSGSGLGGINGIRGPPSTSGLGSGAMLPGLSGGYNSPSGELMAMLNKGGDREFQPMPRGMGSENGSDAGMAAYDMSDFPSLANHSSVPFQAGHGQAHSVDFPKAVMSSASQNAEFAIQSEDFPALPASGNPSKFGGISMSGPEDAQMEKNILGSMGHTPSSLSDDLHQFQASEALSGVDRGHLFKAFPSGSTANAPDRFGLLGLLSVIRMTEPDLNTLALGTDLTTLGLNLNSPECLYATFASPWADSPARRDPEYCLPQCYYMQPPALKTSHFSKLQLESLFYIFYNMPRDTLQAYAATELYNRDWRYHKDLKLWFTRGSGSEGGKGNYIYFDINSWEKKVFNGAGGANNGSSTTPDMATSDQPLTESENVQLPDENQSVPVMLGAE